MNSLLCYHTSCILIDTCKYAATSDCLSDPVITELLSSVTGSNTKICLEREEKGGFSVERDATSSCLDCIEQPHKKLANSEKTSSPGWWQSLHSVASHGSAPDPKSASLYQIASIDGSQYEPCMLSRRRSHCGTQRLSAASCCITCIWFSTSCIEP